MGCDPVFNCCTRLCCSCTNEDRFLYIWRHPYGRAFIAIIIAFLNFLIYAEDPIAHSRSRASLPLIGNAITFVLRLWPDPSTSPGLFICKLIIAPGFLLFGMYMGRQVFHHKLLRDRWGLPMFAENKGTWFIMFFTTILSLFLGSELFNYFVTVGSSKGAASELIHTDYIGLNNENFFRVAATGTWLGDSITAFMVIDMMLQDRYYPDYVHWAPCGRRWWQGKFRIIFFWSAMIIMTTIFALIVYGDLIVWDEYNWGFYTNEAARAFLASVITLFDLLIVMQDWEFPTFESPQDVKIIGFDVEEIKWRPAWIQNEFFEIHVTGKWFNYGIIFVVMGLDFNMLKNQIIYDPPAFGQYTGPDNRVWTIVDETEADRIARSPIERENLTFESREFARSPDYPNPDFVMNSVFSNTPGITAFKYFCVLLSLFGLFLFFWMFHYIGRIGEAVHFFGLVFLKFLFK
jgi:hypothetical protein